MFTFKWTFKVLSNFPLWMCKMFFFCSYLSLICSLDQMCYLCLSDSDCLLDLHLCIFLLISGLAIFSLFPLISNTHFWGVPVWLREAVLEGNTFNSSPNAVFLNFPLPPAVLRQTSCTLFSFNVFIFYSCFCVFKLDRDCCFASILSQRIVNWLFQSATSKYNLSTSVFKLSTAVCMCGSSL